MKPDRITYTYGSRGQLIQVGKLRSPSETVAGRGVTGFAAGAVIGTTIAVIAGAAVSVMAGVVTTAVVGIVVGIPLAVFGGVVEMIRAVCGGNRRGN